MKSEIRFAERVEIASPCHASWEAMEGDDNKRFCGSCQLHVYNLSAMNQSQAEALLTSSEGRLCVRYYRRDDGTVLTQDCPVGLRAVRQRLVRRVAGLAALIAGLLHLPGRDAAQSGQPTMGTPLPPTSQAVVGGIKAPVKSRPIVGKIKAGSRAAHGTQMANGHSVVMGDIASPVKSKPVPPAHPHPYVMGRIAMPPKAHPKPTPLPDALPAEKTGAEDAAQKPPPK